MRPETQGYLLLRIAGQRKRRQSIFSKKTASGTFGIRSKLSSQQPAQGKNLAHAVRKRRRIVPVAISRKGSTSMPASSCTSFTRLERIDSFTSTQPPGKAHKPSAFSCTRRIRFPASNTAARQSSFGVWYPASLQNKPSTTSRDNPLRALMISAAIARTRRNRSRSNSSFEYASPACAKAATPRPISATPVDRRFRLSVDPASSSIRRRLPVRHIPCLWQQSCRVKPHAWPPYPHPHSFFKELIRCLIPSLTRRQVSH